MEKGDFRIVTGFGSLDLKTMKCLVSLEKEFGDGHRGDLNRNNFVNAKQSRSALSRQEGGQSQEGTLCSRSQDPKLSLGSVDMGVASPGNWVNLSLTSGDWVVHHQFLPPMGCVGVVGVLDFEWLDWSCIFHGLQEHWVTRPCCR
jgi:hypothetical protein